MNKIQNTITLLYVNLCRILLIGMVILHSFKTWSQILSFHPSLKFFTTAFSVDHVTNLPAHSKSEMWYYGIP